MFLLASNVRLVRVLNFLGNLFKYFLLLSFPEAPRTPSLSENGVIVSDTCAYLELFYNEAVRVKKLTLHYKEAMYKGFSEKVWNDVEISQLSKGVAKFVLNNLDKGTMYRLYVVASNDFGDSPQSNELWFRTADAALEKRTP